MYRILFPLSVLLLQVTKQKVVKNAKFLLYSSSIKLDADLTGLPGIQAVIVISRFIQFRNTSTMTVQLFEVLCVNETQFLLPNFTKIIN